MTKPRKPKKPPSVGLPRRSEAKTGRQSKASLEGWVWVMQNMIAEIIHVWPPKQQIEVLDGLLQAIVQRLNWLRDREGGLPRRSPTGHPDLSSRKGDGGK